MAAVKDFKVKWGMIIDVDKCTGCGSCMIACQTENNIAPMSEDDASNKVRALSWMLVYELNNEKTYPEYEHAYLARPCMQCGVPACVPVCPVVATEKNEEGGIVSQIPPRCIGCRYCMAACPYHSRYFNWHDPIFPVGMDKTLSPNAALRPRGVVEKCSFCHTRYLKAKDRARQEGIDPMNFPQEYYQTACTQNCPSGAIVFGDLNNPEHSVYEMKKSPNAFRLLEKLGLDPQVYYYTEREWVRKLGDNYLKDEK